MSLQQPPGALVESDLSVILGFAQRSLGALGPNSRADGPSNDAENLAWLPTLETAMPSPPNSTNPWDAFLISLSSPLLRDFQGTVTRKRSFGSDIPDERFAIVARLWPKRREPPGYMIQTLWHDAAHHEGTNLFTESIPDDMDDNSPSMRTNGPQRGLDDARRLLLIKELSLPQFGETEGDHTIHNTTSLPTADTFALCVDLYFQRFHPLFPFIHEPTFSARRTPNIILLPICLIGLHLLDPDETRSFVTTQLLRGIERCTTALTKSWGENDSMLLMTVLGSAILFLNFASILEECAHSEQTHVLYVKALTVAQQSGLFEVSRGPPLMNALSSDRQTDAAWKAWARVESAKRVVACLVATDSFYTSSIGSKPLTQVDVLHIYAPCSAQLFDAIDANSWAKLASTPTAPFMDPPVLDFQGHKIALPTSLSASVMAMHTLLSAAWLYIADLRHRTLPQGIDLVEDSLYPGELFQASNSGASIAPLLRDIYAYDRDGLLTSDPNATAFWNNMCVNLTANLDLFEIAAGREGINAGKTALDKIFIWAQSTHARRACLHAAQIYSCMAKRKISDGTMFMSEIALFNAALVLGLYVYASPATLDVGVEAPLELLDELDWNQIGDEGLAGWNMAQTDSGYAARRFISEGGPISFNRYVCIGGYASARRVILNYVGLLEEVGRWNWRRFRHILRVMSDSMVELT
ncbi:C2H2 type zinc finger domain-containing protein [Ilyonectria sp. MPI-CAGE-AT-0026]|nr:C2H2 type zinc finger domain-containing protein [Ilyonectria sp. MPI-CAGE-AT-0026]